MCGVRCSGVQFAEPVSRDMVVAAQIHNLLNLLVETWWSAAQIYKLLNLFVETWWCSADSQIAAFAS